MLESLKTGATAVASFVTPQPVQNVFNAGRALLSPSSMRTERRWGCEVLAKTTLRVAVAALNYYAIANALAYVAPGALVARAAIWGAGAAAGYVVSQPATHLLFGGIFFKAGINGITDGVLKAALKQKTLTAVGRCIPTAACLVGGKKILDSYIGRCSPTGLLDPTIERIADKFARFVFPTPAVTRS